ncbi:MAG TPA: ATP-dependent DNA ligase [Myxococcota bacterium]|nr:ATP-dependent DNA ligase [Myxococcota bacterium]
MTEYSRLVEASARVAATRARLEKARALAACLRALAPDELEIAVAHLSGDALQGRFGLGWQTLRDAAGAAPADAATLSVREVDERLAELANARGPGSAARRGETLRALFARATLPERDFLVRLLAGELRQGALAGVMLDAIAQAAELPPAELRRAAMYAPSLGVVARTALGEGAAGLARFQLELMSPLAPMLAQTASDVAAALADASGPLAFEWKMDGARVQVHKAGDRVRVFSRSSNEVTDAVPEVVELARALPAAELVLDGEVLAFGSTGRPEPFQVTMRRFGRKLDVAAARARLPLRAFFFDCMRLDGASLADRPLRDRYAALDSAVPAEQRMARLVTDSPSEAQAFYAAALAAGHEGVMAKSLDAPYEAGNRGAAWLKIKRAHTLDLAVIAAEWGHGRRKGKLSNLHLGALDRASGAFVMLGKTFKGLTDEMLEWQTRELLAREVRRAGITVHVRPELVVEVAFSDLQESPRYPAGLALRLARVKRYRDDKRADEADDLETVRRVFAAQSGSDAG